MRLYKFLQFIIVFALFAYSFYLISLHLPQQDLMFHTDIARDFLLIEEVVTTKDLTLIGPKAGGISGMFFGPIWLYSHVLLYLLGNGNPVVIAYFWVFLVLLSILSVGFITYKIFGKTSALVASLIYSFSAATFSSGFTQSFGAVLLSPWLLYFMYLYFDKKRALYLIISLLINGFIYQLQPAVGMITLTATVALSLYTIVKEKKFSYIFLYAVLLIPFSTYILFELRHDFLQVRAFIAHFTGPGLPASDKLTPNEYIHNRLDSYLNIIDLVKRGILTHALFLSLYGYILYLFYKKKPFRGNTYYALFFLYIVSFILLTIIYKGIIIDYYFFAFLPLSIIAFAGLLHSIPNFIYAGITIVVFIASFNSAIGYRGWWNTGFTGTDVSSWKLNKEVAEFVFSDSRGDFGYYVYSTDDLGYSAKYAMSYIQRNESNKGTLCQKKLNTYLIYYPTGYGAKTDPVYWKKVRINLQKEPIMKKQIGTIEIEKYSLSDNEIKESVDPNIVCDLHFR